MNSTLFVPFFECYMVSRFQHHWWSWKTMNDKFTTFDCDDKTVFDYFVLSEYLKYIELCS